jgi:hypothetical protein
MIVMVMRNENGVDGRQLLELDARRRVSPRSGELNGRSALAPDRIGKDAHAV